MPTNADQRFASVPDRCRHGARKNRDGPSVGAIA